MNFRALFTSILAIILWGSTQAQSYVPEIGETKMKIKPKIEMSAYAFNLGDIRLKESIFKGNL